MLTEGELKEVERALNWLRDWPVEVTAQTRPITDVERLAALVNVVEVALWLSAEVRELRGRLEALEAGDEHR